MALLAVYPVSWVARAAPLAPSTPPPSRVFGVFHDGDGYTLTVRAEKKRAGVGRKATTDRRLRLTIGIPYASGKPQDRLEYVYSDERLQPIAYTKLYQGLGALALRASQWKRSRPEAGTRASIDIRLDPANAPLSNNASEKTISISLEAQKDGYPLFALETPDSFFNSRDATLVVKLRQAVGAAVTWLEQ